VRTFKQHLNEGQLKIDFKKFARSEKKKIIKLLNSLEVKRKFNLDSVSSPMLDRSVTVYAYYLDLNDLMDYLKDKGYKWKEGKKMRRTDRPDDIYLENLDEAKKPGKGEATIEVTWDHGKPNPGDVRDWADLGVYLVKAKRNELELEGKKENLVTWLWDFYGWDMKDIEREYKELFR
jgi:hypothetical protein